jgi:hypothetical protein
MISRRIKMKKIFPKIANHFFLSFSNLLPQRKGKKDGLRVMKEKSKKRAAEIFINLQSWPLLFFQKFCPKIIDLWRDFIYTDFFLAEGGVLPIGIFHSLPAYLRSRSLSPEEI